MCGSFFSLFKTGMYHQITRFIQGYVENEVNLNPDQSCSKTCSDYSDTKSYGCATDTVCADYQHIDQASTRCKGTVYNCDKVDDDLTICPVVEAIFGIYYLLLIFFFILHTFFRINFSQYKS